MGLTVITDDDARRELGRYLAARGLDPSLAAGPVGDRYLTRRAAGDGRTPAEAFANWFAETLGGAPGEAEALGWVAFIIAGRSGGELLSPLSAEAAHALISRAPRPACESPLAMPVQQLNRARMRTQAPAPGATPGAVLGAQGAA